MVLFVLHKNKGDEYGFYEDSKKIYDIIIHGNKPPGSNMQAVNTYLCEVNYLGEDFFPALGETELFDKYEVIDWYPIYPVKRDTILPSWLFPKAYLSEEDLK